MRPVALLRLQWIHVAVQAATTIGMVFEAVQQHRKPPLQKRWPATTLEEGQVNAKDKAVTMVLTVVLEWQLRQQQRLRRRRFPSQQVPVLLR